MTIEINKADIETAIGETNSEVELRDDYSGRGMYGEDTWAVVGEPRSLSDFETQLAKAVVLGELGGYNDQSAEDVIELFVEKLDELRVRRYEDSMGMSKIWYYPSIKLED